MLKVEGLSAGYDGILALHGVSLSVPRATITAVLGANGAGKTTLLRTISGLVQARRGRVSLAGTDLTGRRPEDIVRAGVSHVPEGRGVIAELTVEENLRLGALWRPDRADRAAALATGLRALPAARRAAPASPRPPCPAASGRCW